MKKSNGVNKVPKKASGVSNDPEKSERWALGRLNSTGRNEE